MFFFAIKPNKYLHLRLYAHISIYLQLHMYLINYTHVSQAKHPGHLQELLKNYRSYYFLKSDHMNKPQLLFGRRLLLAWESFSVTSYLSTYTSLFLSIYIYRYRYIDTGVCICKYKFVMMHLSNIFLSSTCQNIWEISLKKNIYPRPFIEPVSSLAIENLLRCDVLILIHLRKALPFK